MSLPVGFNFGLGSLALLSEAETRSISAENPDGLRGGGAKAEPTGDSAARELGRGWKVRPCITVKAGETVALAEVTGPGVIQHIWITVRPEGLTGCVLRMYWDDEETPCVETPLGDFFACGHGLRTKVNSLPVAVNPTGGLNCYWPMPFRKSARITVENQWHEDIGGFFYQITYALSEVPFDKVNCSGHPEPRRRVDAESGYFHAQYRKSLTRRDYPEHVLLDGVKGQGHYVGTYLAWVQMSNGWWGEGEMKFYVDGDGEFPTICGTGTEDYFGGAWGFGGETFSTAFLGYPLYEKVEGRVPRHGLYRWHVMDPIRFKQDLKVTVQALGWWPGRKYEPLTDDIASVAYWYQTLPHGQFPPLAGLNERLPR